MKRGFTLVELSIVLVIIGLLIGGILVAQSMIYTSKINAQIKQIQEFDVATANFKTKYGQLPGDSSAMGCASSNCNNGVVMDSPSWNAGLHSSWHWWIDEVATFWPNLSASGLKGDAYSATVPATGLNTGAAKNLPEAIIGKKAMFLVASGRSKWPDTNYYNHYFLADFSAVVSAAGEIFNEVGVAAVSPNDMLAIDTKTDDASPSAGMVRVRGVGAPTGSYLSWGGPSASCVSGGRYVSSNDLTCMGMIELLGSTNLQN